MAKIRDFTVTEVTGTSTNPSAQVEYPAHETNDILILMLQVDGSNTPSLPSGYTNLQNGSVGGGSFRLCYKVAASSDEVCPTLSLGAADTWHIGVFAISGADYADPINVSGARTTTDAASPFTWTSGLSTDEDNVLILQFLTFDGGVGGLCVTPGYTNLVNGDAGANGFNCAVGFQPTLGAITNIVWNGFTNDDTQACLVAINDDGNGTRPGYCDPSTSATFLKHIAGTALTESDTNPASLAYGAIGMKNVSQCWRYEGTTFTDETTDINSAATADVTLANTIGNMWYFGYDYLFSNMVVQISTAQAGGTIVWEYWNGTAWSSFTMTGVLTAAGWARLTFTPNASWAATSVNGVSKYYIRMRISATFTTAPILSRAHIGGWLTTYDAIGAATDAGINPYSNATSLTPAATSNFSGSEQQFGSALNMAAGVLLIHHKSALPRDYAVDVAINDVVYPVTNCGKAGKAGSLQNYGGYVIVLGDASSNYEAYSIHGKKSLTHDNAGYNVAAIGLNNGATPYGQIGTLNKSAVTRMLMLPQGPFGAMASHVSIMSLWTNFVFAGGDSASPLNVSELRRIINNSMGVSLAFNGVGDFNRVYAPIQFGGGHTIKISVNGAIFQFPTKYDGQKYFDYNGDDNVLGVTFYGTGANDELLFPNCTWKGSQPFKWGFHASHSASAELDFTGNTVEGATITLQSTVVLEGLKFINCPSFTQNGAELSVCSFTNTKVSSSSPANAAKISYTTFTKTTGTQHAIEISGTAANMTLTNVDFVGYAASDGSTGNEAIYVNIASGSMTINVSGGNTPSIRTAGATVTVVNSVILTVTDIEDGSDVVIYEAGTETILDDSQENVGTTFQYTYDGTDAGNFIDIGVFKAGLVPFYIRSYELGATNGSVPVAQVVDRAYIA